MSKFIKTAKIRNNEYTIVLVLVLFLGFSELGVNAQESPPAVNVTMNQQQNAVPRSERMNWVNEHSQHAKSIYRKVQNMLEQARQEKDSIKITCLDDKLTQISVNLRGIEVRKEALSVALKSNDNTASDQHFTILSIYSTRVNGLEAEAENCIGASDVVLGESDVTVTVSEDITQDDPSTDGIDIYQHIGVEQLPQASGYY